MSYAQVLTGVYSISNEEGSSYIGGSTHIYRRWSEHKRHLRAGTHYCEKLQEAWIRSEGRMRFSILEICTSDILLSREQYYLDRTAQALNTTPDVLNVWANPETRAKLNAAHSSDKWRKDRSLIGSRATTAKRTPVDCSNGETYASLQDAAKAFGIKASGVKHLVLTHRIGRLGVRFKYVNEEWRDALPHHEQAWQTRLANCNHKHTEETKEKMRLAKVGYVPRNKGVSHTPEAKAKMAASQKRIEVMDAETGTIYASCIEASRKTGVSRTHLRRLLAQGRRFSLVNKVPPVCERKASR